MKNELRNIKEEYSKVKKTGDLEYDEYKRIASLKNKIDVMISKLRAFASALEEISEYTDSISIAKMQVKKELDNLEIMKATI